VEEEEVDLQLKVQMLQQQVEDLEERDYPQFLDHQQHHQAHQFMVEEAEELLIEEVMEVEDLVEVHQHLEQQQLILEEEAEEDLLEAEEELEVLEELLLDSKHNLLLLILLVDGL
jgi:hypothetical protein